MTHAQSAPQVRAFASLALLAAAATLSACKADEPVAPRDNSVVRFQQNDPAGDTLDNSDPSVTRALDLRGTTVRTNGDTIIFVLHFSIPVKPPTAASASSVYGFIDLDTDQDPSTGLEASSDVAGGTSGIGADYFIDIDEGNATSAPVGDEQLHQVGTASAIYAGDSAVFRLARSVIGGDDGHLDFTVAAATADRYTDIAPNDGFYTLNPAASGVVTSLSATAARVGAAPLGTRSASTSGARRRLLLRP